MKILGISGSPRKNGNSATLLKEVLRGAESNNAETELIHIADFNNLHHCIHCDKCQEKGICVFNDDMTTILEKIKECDVLVIASPLHFTGISSQLKQIIDRGQVIWANKYILKNHIFGTDKKCIFISVAARDDVGQFDGSIKMISDFLRCADITLEKALKFTNLENVNNANSRTDYLKECFDTGIELSK